MTPSRPNGDLGGNVIALLTVGYEGTSVEDFIATLEQPGVATLLDIRELKLQGLPHLSRCVLHLTNRASDSSSTP